MRKKIQNLAKTPRANSTPETKWFREEIADDLIFARRNCKSDPIHFANTADSCRKHINALIKRKQSNYNIRIPSIEKPRYSDYKNHLDGTGTLYYTNKCFRGDFGPKKILMNIDIDIMKSGKIGSIGGAHKLKRILRAKLGKNLFFEASTSGNSLHGYVFIDIGSCTYDTLKESLNMFELWLQKTASESKANIELVELKGHPGQTICKNGEITTIKCGQLAKVPFALRSTKNTKKLKKTIVININSILNGNFGVKHAFSLSKNSNKKTINPIINGSFSSNIFTKSDLNKLDHYEKVALALFGSDLIVPTGKNCKNPRRRRVTPGHFAIAILIMEKLKNSPNNELASISRYSGIWKALYQKGHVKHAFQRNVFCFIKNELSNRGFIEWKNSSYIFSKNKNIKPLSSEWLIDESILNLLNNINKSFGNPMFEFCGPQKHQKSTLKKDSLTKLVTKLSLNAPNHPVPTTGYPHPRPKYSKEPAFRASSNT